VEEKLLQLYERLEGVVNGSLCEGCGAECCYFEFSGHLPFLTRPEWDLILKHTGDELPPAQVIVCPFLDSGSGSCTIYRVRPFRCRLYHCSRYPGADLPSSQLSMGLDPFREEYLVLTRGLPQRSLVDLLGEG
jgi:hypothetical protein